MGRLVVPAALLVSMLIFVRSIAQQLPLVYGVENTGANFPKPTLPSMSQFPSIQALPDSFEWADGRGPSARS